MTSPFSGLSRRRLLGSAAAIGTAAALPPLLAGCGGDDAEGSGGDTDGRPSGPSTFPADFPEVPSPVDPSSYDYDDLATQYDITLMANGPFSQPRPDDPIAEFLNKEFNAKLKYTSLTAEDMRNKLALSFSGGDGPDFVCLPAGLRDVAAALFDQGQLLAADELLGLMPQAAGYVTEGFRKWATVDDEMMGIPIYSVQGDIGNNYIRTDFLKTLGMDVPKTTDELYAYAEGLKSTKLTPGKDGPWFMATGGGGNGWGMIDFLKTYFGHPSWNVIDGKINHPMLDGTQRAYLEYVARLRQDGLLPPDWYTTAWEPLKSRTFNDQLGMVNYPGWNLADETWDATDHDFEAVQAWAPMGALTSPDGGGGKLPPGNNPGSLYLFNAKLAEDEGKLRRIAHMIDTFVYPNVNYWNVAQGGGPDVWPDDVTVEFDEKTGQNLFTIHEDAPVKTDSKYGGLPDWQAFGYTLRWQTYDDKVGKLGVGWNHTTEKLPRYENFDVRLNLDPQPVQDVITIADKNEIQFVLGKRSFDEWDSYVADWKKAGGQELIDQAAEQLGAQPA